MRILLLSLAIAALSACATTPASTSTTPATSTVAPATPTPPMSSRVGQLLAAAGRQNAPTQAEVERALGPADITRRDGSGVALTYAMDHCALLLVFAANPQNQMRLADAHPSARQTGEGAPSLDQCAAEATTRRPS